jgi:uridine kinase
MQLVSTPRVEFLRGIAGEIGRLYPKGRVVVAVDGLIGSGTGDFAAMLARVFGEAGRIAFTASMEDFHRQRAERYRLGRTSPEGFYADSYDYRTLRRALVDPFRLAGSTGFQTAAFDLVRNAPVLSAWQTGPADLVLIVEGVFLNRPELRGLWDYSIYLDVPMADAYARLAAERGFDADPLAPANERYRGGQERYLAEMDPAQVASAVVDNVDPEAPRRVFSDSC